MYDRDPNLIPVCFTSRQGNAESSTIIRYPARTVARMTEDSVTRDGAIPDNVKS